MTTSPFQRICVALDDSPASAAALGAAIAIIGDGGELVLANAINRAAVIAECTTPYGGDASMALEVFEDNQGILFSEALARCKTSGIRATAVSLDGNAASELTTYVREHPVDAIAMGTHARHGIARLVLGSTADAVLRASSVPVFATSEQGHSRIEGGITKIFLAFDESEAALAATEFALALARDCKARIAFGHVREERPETEAQAAEAMNHAVQRATDAGLPCDRLMLRGPAVETIATAADAASADLIVIGTHGRSGLTRLRLGSVAEGVLQTATVPVVVVPVAAHVRGALTSAS
jgi:nucleotide-binding universal stress UspA family protein